MALTHLNAQLAKNMPELKGPKSTWTQSHVLGPAASGTGRVVPGPGLRGDCAMTESHQDKATSFHVRSTETPFGNRAALHVTTRIYTHPA